MRGFRFVFVLYRSLVLSSVQSIYVIQQGFPNLLCFVSAEHIRSNLNSMLLLPNLFLLFAAGHDVSGRYMVPIQAKFWKRSPCETH